jgi:hypothetical protein
MSDAEKAVEVEEVPEPTLSPENEAALDGLISDFEPEKEKASGASDDKQSAEMVGMFYAGAFGILASRMGGHWALSSEEVEALSVPTVAVVKKYLPNAKAGPEAALLGAVAFVVLPRLMVGKEPEPEPEEAPVEPAENEGEATYGNEP